MTFTKRLTHPGKFGAHLRYSEDQPRDEHGRFGSGGSETAAPATSAFSRDAQNAAIERWGAIGGQLTASPEDRVLMEHALRERGESSRVPLYRGTEGMAPHVGETINEPLASASPQMDVAQAYAENVETSGVLYEYPPGTVSLDISSRAEVPAEQEHLVGGNFKVSAVSEVEGTPLVHLELSGKPWEVSEGYSKRSWRPYLRYSEDQPRDEHGRFGSGGGGSKDASGPPAAFATHVAEFQAAGGEIHQVDAAEADAKLDEVRQTIGEIMGTSFAHGTTRDATGMRFTTFALQGDGGENPVTFVAEAYGLGVAGAMDVYDVSGTAEPISETNPAAAVYIDYLGTMGTVEGTGSALVQEGAKYAADRGLPIVGSPTADAAPWWSGQVGWHDDPLNLGMSVDGLTVAETAALAKA